jgi:selenide, water dikinase
MGPCDLDAVLESLPRTGEAFARLLDTRDDAAVVELGDGRCLLQTVDFFTPIVDTPYLYGRIAAANSLSDVYAMGGRPLTALNLVGWPASLPTDVLTEVLRGGADAVAEAGAQLAGGHSVEMAEPIYGLAVTGVCACDEVVTNAAARRGDLLVLTKRLGIGVLATALKRGLIDEDGMRAAIDEAAALNAAASQAMAAAGADACTDVTGFGLLGHLSELLEASGAAAEVAVEDVPLHAGVLDFIARDVTAAGLRNNRDYFGPRVSGRGLDEPAALALFDPQTSGGLLIAVPAERHETLLSVLREGGAGAWTVGEVVSGPVGRIALT